MPIVGMPVQATGDIIEAAPWNDLAGNISLLDARTGGDPGAAGKIAISNGASSAVWTLLTALTNAITTTGIITAAGFQAGASGVNGGAGGVNGGLGGVDGGAGGVDGGAGGYHGGSLTVGIPQMLGLLIGASGASIGLGGVSTTGPIAGAAVSGTTGTFTGLLTSVGVTSSNFIAGTQVVASVTDGVTRPFVVDAAQAGVLNPNVYVTRAQATDTIPLGAVDNTNKMGTGVVTSTNILNDTIVDADVNSAYKDGAAGTASLRTLGPGAAQAAAGNHTHTATGAYTGDGAATRNITVGFTPKQVTIIRTDTPTMWTTLGNNAVSIQHNIGSAAGSVAGLTFGATTFQVTTTSGTNANSGTYIWVALG